MRPCLWTWIGDQLHQHLLRQSDSLVLDGIWIGAIDEDAAVLLPRVVEALTLIKTHDPVRYARLTRDIDRIWLRPTPGAMAQYQHRFRLIAIDRKYLHQSDNELAGPLIASLIVHEATHPRLMRFGYEEAVRVRIERCCVGQEITFARRYEGGEAIIRWNEAMVVDDATISDHSRAQRRREGEIELAREAGMPLWIVRLFHRMRARQAKLTQAN